MIIVFDTDIFEEKVQDYDEVVALGEADNMLASKKNATIGDLAKHVDTAIAQERKINENIYDCKGKVTCNIGRIIESIRSDTGK